MAKDIENAIEFFDYKNNLEKINELLNTGKTIKVALQNGQFVQEALKSGYSEWSKANYELANGKPVDAKCFCGKSADIWVYMWR